jgi:glycosyltransferase involved in cell wall biosynthesis
MKLALIVPGGVDRSGESRVIPALLALLRDLGSDHEVHVYALWQESARADWRLCGAHVHNIGCGLVRWRTLAAIAAEQRRAPFDRIQSIWSGACGQIAVLAKLWLRVPTGVHVAGGELADVGDIGYGGGRFWPRRVLERMTLRAADEVTAASQPLLDQLAEWGIRAHRATLGLDRHLWPMQPPVRRVPLEPLRCIHVANLNAVKDQDTLLRAMRLLRTSGLDFHLDIVGEDTLSGSVQSLAQHLGLEHHVRFHGFLTQRQMRPLLARAHILVMSSRHEAGPVVVLEAARVGVPTVGTAVGHIAEWAPAAARAVPVRDARALAAALAELAANEDERLLLAHCAQQRCEFDLLQGLGVRLQSAAPNASTGTAMYP